MSLFLIDSHFSQINLRFITRGVKKLILLFLIHEINQFSGKLRFKNRCQTILIRSDVRLTEFLMEICKADWCNRQKLLRRELYKENSSKSLVLAVTSLCLVGLQIIKLSFTRCTYLRSQLNLRASLPFPISVMYFIRYSWQMALKPLNYTEFNVLINLQ